MGVLDSCEKPMARKRFEYVSARLSWLFSVARWPIFWRVFWSRMGCWRVHALPQTLRWFTIRIWLLTSFPRSSHILFGHWHIQFYQINLEYNKDSVLWICTLKKREISLSFTQTICLGIFSSCSRLSSWRCPDVLMEAGQEAPLCHWPHVVKPGQAARSMGQTLTLFSSVFCRWFLFTSVSSLGSFLPSSKEAISFFLISLSLDVASSRKSPWTFFFLPELVSSGPSPLYSVAARVTQLHAVHLCICLLCWTVSSMVTRTGTSYMPSYFWYPANQ